MITKFWQKKTGVMKKKSGGVIKCVSNFFPGLRSALAFHVSPFVLPDFMPLPDAKQELLHAGHDTKIAVRKNDFSCQFVPSAEPSVDWSGQSFEISQQRRRLIRMYLFFFVIEISFLVF